MTEQHTTESMKVEEINMVGLMTQDRQQQEPIGANMKELQEKGSMITTKSKRLEEASRLNLEKEREIRQRMAALDAVSNYAILLVKR